MARLMQTRMHAPDHHTNTKPPTTKLSTHPPTQTHTETYIYTKVSERASSNHISSSKRRLECLSPELKHSSLASFDPRSIKLQNITRNYPEFPLPGSASLSTQTARYGICKSAVVRKCRVATLGMKNCVL